MHTIQDPRAHRTPIDDIEYETDRQNARTVMLDAADVRQAVTYARRLERACRAALPALSAHEQTGCGCPDSEAARLLRSVVGDVIKAGTA